MHYRARAEHCAGGVPNASPFLIRENRSIPIHKTHFPAYDIIGGTDYAGFPIRRVPLRRFGSLLVKAVHPGLVAELVCMMGEWCAQHSSQLLDRSADANLAELGLGVGGTITRAGPNQAVADFEPV